MWRLENYEDIPHTHHQIEMTVPFYRLMTFELLRKVRTCYVSTNIHFYVRLYQHHERYIQFIYF
jgi:hypothetical protein